MSVLIITFVILVFIKLIVINLFFPGFIYNLVIALERKSARLSKKFTTVDNHTICYLEGGSGETILLIHGYNGDKDNWTRMAKYLTGKYHVISIDDPGFGESSYYFEKSYTIQNQAERINSLCEKLGIDKCHVAGNSMGGAIAGYFASAYPERVITLGLFDAGGVSAVKKSEYFSTLDKNKNRLLCYNASDYVGLLDLAFTRPPFTTAPIRKYLGKKNCKRKDINIKIFDDIMADFTALENNLSKIEAETLIIWGNDDRILDISAVSVFEKGIKKARSVIFKNCGHVPQMERPRKTANTYLHFIGEISYQAG